jgi:diguanylate cyclase (GGDEF)-like protein
VQAETPPVSLDRLMTTVAGELMATNATTSVTVSQHVLAVMVEYFDVDASFLRYNDHAIRASILVAEWPPRRDVPDPDPLQIVFFRGADPVFASSEHAKTPVVFRPDDENYREGIEEERRIPQTSIVVAPLLSGDVTTGMLGFLKIGDREWKPEELKALEAIASLFAQVQARIQAEERLRYLAEHDDLTGLQNRRALIQHLDARLSAGCSRPVSAIYLDVDRLKTINDYLGHSAGDWFIRVIAERLEQGTEDASLIARLGGDEFVVIPPSSMSTVEAEQLAHRLLALLCERVLVDGEMLTRTVSIGVALGTPGRDDTSDLLRRADQAVLTAKGAGGNQVAVFSDEMSLRTDYRNDIELHLPDVIENGALFLQYLPEVDMRTGEVLAAEALVRWNHPTRGLLSPATFIAVAESINLAADLGHWVLRTACKEFSRWRALGIADGIVLKVNVSPVQLVTDGFVESVAAMMREFVLGRGSVCLEITESIVVQDMEAASVTLAGLRDVGVQVAIDDFGTGFSVLSHLKSLPVDVLKIDRSFVAELGSNPDDLAIVRAVIALAEAFELELVAEGVETEIAAMTLLRHGCHRAQGFLLSRPLSGEDMALLLAEGRVPTHFSTSPSL